MGQGGSRPWADLFPFVVLLVVDPLHKPSSFSLLSGQLEVLDCSVLGTMGLHWVCIEITPWRAGRKDLLPGSRADGDVLTLTALCCVSSLEQPHSPSFSLCEAVEPVPLGGLAVLGMCF